MSWGVALRNAVGLGLGGIPSVLNAPPYASLKLNFTEVNALDPRITFSRGSNATLIGSNGLLQYAPHNLFLYSEQFDNAYWNVTAATVSANAVSAPDGTQTADQLVETAGTGTLPRLPVPITLNVGQTYSASVYAKEVPGSSKRYLQVYFNASFATVPCGANFDLATGTVTLTTGLASTAVESVGNGWWRCTINTTVVTTAPSGFRVALVDSPTQPMSVAWNPNGTGSLYLWGAQLNVGALQPYYQTVASAYYGPRFDYDPATLAARGLLIEEQRTNLCLYSEDLNQAAWAKGSSVSLTYDTTVAPDGTTTADTITVVSGADTGVYQSIACSSSTAYTFSLYVKLGTMVASDYKIAIYDNTNAAFIAVDIVPSQTPSSTAWTRVTYTFTTPATCVSVRVYCFRNSLSAATSVNVWGMQLEAGAFATSYIPTTTTALTRATDVASMTGANFSDWYNQVNGTVVAEYTFGSGSGANSQVIYSFSDGGEINRLIGYRTVGLVQQFDETSGGGSVTTGAGASNTTYKTALSYATNNLSASTNGSAVVSDTSVTISTKNQLTLGDRATGTRALNGLLRSFSYYPKQLSAGQLQALSK